MEPQLRHPHRALGLSTSYFPSPNLRFSQVKATQCRVSELTSIMCPAHSRCTADAHVPTRNCLPWRLSLQTVAPHPGSLASPICFLLAPPSPHESEGAFEELTASGNGILEHCHTVALEAEITRLRNRVRLERAVRSRRGQRPPDAHALRSRFALISQT